MKSPALSPKFSETDVKLRTEGTEPREDKGNPYRPNPFRFLQQPELLLFFGGPWKIAPPLCMEKNRACASSQGVPRKLSSPPTPELQRNKFPPPGG